MPIFIQCFQMLHQQGKQTDTLVLKQWQGQSNSASEEHKLTAPTLNLNLSDDSAVNV